LANATAAVVIASGLAMAGASPASADQVWHQSVGRASADAACPTSDPADLATGWTQWAASWEKWANDSKGGYVCSRAITWAKDTPPPSVEVALGCTQIQVLPATLAWADFGSGYYLPIESPLFADSACSESIGPSGAPAVYATSAEQADARCDASLPGTVAGTPPGLAENIYVCFD
jgi:hypothetical protein